LVSPSISIAGVPIALLILISFKRLAHVNTGMLLQTTQRGGHF
jgi:hypothetical protein